MATTSIVVTIVLESVREARKLQNERCVADDFFLDPETVQWGEQSFELIETYNEHRHVRSRVRLSNSPILFK